MCIRDSDSVPGVVFSPTMSGSPRPVVGMVWAHRSPDVPGSWVAVAPTRDEQGRTATCRRSPPGGPGLGLPKPCSAEYYVPVHDRAPGVVSTPTMSGVPRSVVGVLWAHRPPVVPYPGLPGLPDPQ